MANNGPHSNQSQFFITTAAAPNLDGENCAFGVVTDGLELVVHIAGMETDDDDVPIEHVNVIACGRL